MKKVKNKIYITYADEVFEYFKSFGATVGHGGPYFKWLDSKRNLSELQHNKFLKHTAKNLVLTGYLDFKRPFTFLLTQSGYDYTQGGALLCNNIDLTQFVDLHVDAASQFNMLWEIIGKEESALFYVGGPLFYKVASALIIGLPSDYSTYLSSLDQPKRRRNVWFRELYLSMDDDTRKRFLQALSLSIKDTYEEYYPSPLTGEEEMLEWASNFSEEIDNKNMSIMQGEKKIKIFISHSSKDKKIVEALVDLLIILGVNNKEQMFCSSCPPFDVKVNDDIFATLKEQYQNYNLYMIYMLSDNYYESPFSLNEMGAGWVLLYDYQCVTLPGFSPNDIKGCVDTKKKALVLDSETLGLELNDFKNDIIKLMGLPSIDPKIWEMKRDRFIEEIKRKGNTEKGTGTV